MLIPAMDAVNSGRFGFIHTDTYTILARLYDQGVENQNHGETYQRAVPIWYRTSEPTAFESALQPTQDECRELSDDFYRMMDLLHEMITPSRGDNEPIELDVTKELDLKYEQQCVQQLFGTVLDNEQISDVIHSLAKEGFRHQNPEFDTGFDNDFEITENSSRSFTESDFTSQRYIPKQGNEWDFVLYTFDHNGMQGSSLWLRYTTEGDRLEEIPLVSNMKGLFVVVDKSPDFGTTNEDRLSAACLRGLENETIPDEVTDDEAMMLEMVNNMDLPTETQMFVDDATNAQSLL